MANMFVGITDEIELRMSIKQVYKNEGMEGIYKCIGELSTSLNIILEVAKEILQEEKKAK